jgi:very-short-patch-repair endonuclease
MITGPIETVECARKLRSEMSLPEILLWRALRARPGGLKFRRQHPAGPYVLDFYCAAARLAIEIDGFVHDSEPAAKRDEARSRSLRSQGVATLRVPAKIVLEDMERVVARIVEVASARAPLHLAAHGPPPRAGEDL